MLVTMRIFWITLLFLPACAWAAPEPSDKYLAHCHVTPAIQHNHVYPGETAIVPSNKLALPAGKSAYAKGQLVYISGRVLDENCVPVSDAIVDIWQADPEGKYIQSRLSDRINPFPNFAGSGRAITNNLGRFDFVTLLPGTYGHPPRAPHINVHVTKERFGTLNTEMFFYDKPDPVLSHLHSTQQALLIAKTWPRGDSLASEWDITLKGKNPWRHF